MNAKQTIKEYLRLFEPKTIREELEAYKIITDACMFLIRNCGTYNTHFDRDGYLLFQMSSLKSISILKLALSKIAYSNDFTDLQMRVYDPFGIQPIIRSQFEAYGNFNNIYINCQDKHEALLKFDLWVMCGLLERQKFPATEEENKVKKEKERKDIEELEKSIRENICFKLLTLNSQKLIFEKAKRPDWKLVIQGNNGRFVGWQQLFDNSGKRTDLLEQFYRMFSLDSHPTYLSVMQFREMYDPTDFSETRTKIAIKLSNIIMSFFIVDYCRFSKDAAIAYEKLPDLHQLLIGANNQTFRGEEYLLNPINKQYNEQIAEMFKQKWS